MASTNPPCPNGKYWTGHEEKAAKPLQLIKSVESNIAVSPGQTDGYEEHRQTHQQENDKNRPHAESEYTVSPSSRRA